MNTPEPRELWNHLRDAHGCTLASVEALAIFAEAHHEALHSAEPSDVERRERSGHWTHVHEEGP